MFVPKGKALGQPTGRGLRGAIEETRQARYELDKDYITKYTRPKEFKKKGLLSKLFGQ